MTYGLRTSTCTCTSTCVPPAPVPVVSLWYPSAAQSEIKTLNESNDDLTGLLAALNITVGEQPAAFADTAALSPGVQGKASPKPPHPPEVVAVLPHAPGPAERGSLTVGTRQPATRDTRRRPT